MRVHLVGLPHTSFIEANHTNCAFTTKSVRMAHMLAAQGHDVHVYWAGETEPGPWTFHSLLSIEEQESFFGPYDPLKLPQAVFDPAYPYWRRINTRAIKAMLPNMGVTDVIAIVAGSTQQKVVDAFPRHIKIEPEVGYEGIASNTHCCFESYAWMHHRYGANGINDGRAFDVVIPNFHDPANFELGTDGGYLLFMGRLMGRKGPHVAADVAKRAGIKLLVAGNGLKEIDGDDLICEDGTRVTNATYLGSLGIEERKEVLSHATALIVPTIYIEPFGTVQIEAMLSGVPVIAPDYGVFSETIEENVNGFRYRMVRDAVAGVKKASSLRGQFIRDYAIERYSMEVCGRKYGEWLDRLATLHGEGWYAE